MKPFSPLSEPWGSNMPLHGIVKNPGSKTLMNHTPTEPAPDVITLEMLLHRYISEISSKKSPTAHARDSRIARHLTVRLGATPLEEVTPLLLTRFRDARLKEASAHTVARDLALLAHVIETAMQQWTVAMVCNPVHLVAAPPHVHGRGRHMRPGERVRLLAACQRHSNPMLGWVVTLILETGMRKGEILGLQQSQVDLAQRVAHLSRTGTWAPRVVPLNQTAIMVFQKALQHTAETPHTTLIFFGEPGKFGRRKPYAVDRVLRQVMSRANLKPFGCDELRDDAILRMQEAGLTEEEVVAITGRRSMRIDRRAPHLQAEVLLKRLDTLGF